MNRPSQEMAASWPVTFHKTVWEFSYMAVLDRERERERERPCIDPREKLAGRLALRPVITFRSLSRPSKEHCALTIVSQLNQPLRFLVCRPRDNGFSSHALSFLPGTMHSCIEIVVCVVWKFDRFSNSNFGNFQVEQSDF